MGRVGVSCSKAPRKSRGIGRNKELSSIEKIKEPGSEGRIKIFMLPGREEG